MAGHTLVAVALPPYVKLHCANFPRSSCTFLSLRSIILHISPSHSPLKGRQCSQGLATVALGIDKPQSRLVGHWTRPATNGRGRAERSCFMVVVSRTAAALAHGSGSRWIRPWPACWGSRSAGQDAPDGGRRVAVGSEGATVLRGRSRGWQTPIPFSEPEEDVVHPVSELKT